MENRATAGSIDDYISGFPPDIGARLQEMREIIRAAAPDVTETISYAIPTLDLNGKHVVHFAAFKKHIGFYPTPSGVARFREDLKTYKIAKGSIQLPFREPLPRELIARIVKFRVAEISGPK